LDAQDASGAAARADARAEDGGTPQTGTEEANGANVADGKGVEFGAQPGAGDGGKTAHGATANWRVAAASEAADGLALLRFPWLMTAGGRFCAHPAQMAPAHHGIEQLVWGHTTEVWSPRLIASSTLFVDARRSSKTPCPEQVTKVPRNCTEKYSVDWRTKSAFSWPLGQGALRV